MSIARIISAIAFFLFLFSACNKGSKKSDPPANTQKLSYGDSVFYIKNQSYTISPINPRSGTYTAFPDNLLIDNTTGMITVSIIGNGQESQTGMRYKINYRSDDGAVLDSNYIILAGINYLDRIYYLSQNDTIVYPVYNASLSNGLPAGTYGIQPDSRLAIDPSTGRINLKECIRKGFFNIPAENGEWEEVTIQYRSNDKSNSALNSMDIAIYYYDHITDMPSNVSAVMRAHQKMTLGISQPEIPPTTGPIDNDLPDNISFTKPRPPCIIIIGN